ncbi:hypothetical protein ACWD4V_18165 [Streptomyces tsukubensis]
MFEDSKSLKVREESFVARHARSVPPDKGIPVDRIECQHCKMVWHRPSGAGRPPHFCSDACKQAAWRLRAQLKLRDLANSRLRNTSEDIERFHAELAAITLRTPLRETRILPLLRELAGAPLADRRTAQQLYKAAVLRWHPDTGGDTATFQLLQAAYHEAKRYEL